MRLARYSSRNARLVGRFKKLLSRKGRLLTIGRELIRPTLVGREACESNSDDMWPTLVFRRRRKETSYK